MAVQVRRYSRVHLKVSVSVRGRGVFFSRTPDGAWRSLRPRRCTERGWWDDTDGTGVREQRRPVGPDLGTGAGLELP